MSLSSDAQRVMERFPDAHFIEHVSSDGDIAGVSNPLLIAFKVVGYDEPTGSIEACENGRVSVYKRLYPGDFWDEFLSWKGIPEAEEGVE